MNEEEMYRLIRRQIFYYHMKHFTAGITGSILGMCIANKIYDWIYK